MPRHFGMHPGLSGPGLASEFWFEEPATLAVAALSDGLRGTRYEHIHVRLFRAVHGPQQFLERVTTACIELFSKPL